MVAIIYFTVFPNSPAARLDQGAVAVAGSFTKLGWNEHNCRAASRYSVGALPCPSNLLPAGSYAFPLNAWRIRH